MIERPILFNGEMVRAILKGRKTQTRRVVKPQPNNGNRIPYRTGKERFVVNIRDPKALEMCPYGTPGDQLWVRETWGSLNDYTGDPYDPGPAAFACGCFYKADYDHPLDPLNDELERWRPSIHMPRRLSRINLLVKDVRVERVQDISSRDISAEGITCDREPDCKPGNFCTNRIKSFMNLWNSINEKRGYGWAENPWVWVVEFEAIK